MQVSSLRLGLLARDRLDDPGDQPGLELTQGAPDRRHPGAGHALVDVDVDPRAAEHRHLDDAERDRAAQLEELLELGDPEVLAELLARHVRGRAGTAPDDVLQGDQPEQPVQGDARPIAELRPDDREGIRDVDALARDDLITRGQVGILHRS